MPWTAYHASQVTYDTNNKSAACRIYPSHSNDVWEAAVTCTGLLSASRYFYKKESLSTTPSSIQDSSNDVQFLVV